MARVRTELSGAGVAITGAARGIGLATATAFHAAGAKVALGDLDADLAVAAAATLGDGAFGAALDVTDADSFRAFVERAEERVGPLRVLVNNAGIMPTGLFVDEPDAMTDRMLAVNLRAVITGSRIGAARFAERGGGVVVNVASLAGVLYAPALATYCATKHAVLGLTESLDRELEGSGVRALAILPGLVRTELSAGASYPPWLDRFIAVEPADVADAVVRAVRRGRARSSVPAGLGVALRGLDLLPRGVRRAVERRAGLDRAFATPDPAARELYHRRIAGGPR